MKNLLDTRTQKSFTTRTLLILLILVNVRYSKYENMVLIFAWLLKYGWSYCRESNFLNETFQLIFQQLLFVIFSLVVNKDIVMEITLR